MRVADLGRPIRAGELNRVVTLRRRVDTGEVTSHNAPIFELEDVRTFWAALVERFVEEDFSAATEQRYAARRVIFRCRYMSDVDATSVLVCDGQNYNVRGVHQIGRREGLEIVAEWQE